MVKNMPLDSNTNLYENETIKKIEELSQTEINNIKDVKLVFKYLSDCNILINKIQQLQKELEELKKKFIEFNFKDDGEAYKDAEQLNKIESYLKN